MKGLKTVFVVSRPSIDMKNYIF